MKATKIWVFCSILFVMSEFSYSQNMDSLVAIQCCGYIVDESSQFTACLKKFHKVNGKFPISMMELEKFIATTPYVFNNDNISEYTNTGATSYSYLFSITKDTIIKINDSISLISLKTIVSDGCTKEADFWKMPQNMEIVNAGVIVNNMRGKITHIKTFVPNDYSFCKVPIRKELNIYNPYPPESLEYFLLQGMIYLKTGSLPKYAQTFDPVRLNELKNKLKPLFDTSYSLSVRKSILGEMATESFDSIAATRVYLMLEVKALEFLGDFMPTDTVNYKIIGAVTEDNYVFALTKIKTIKAGVENWETTTEAIVKRNGRFYRKLTDEFEAGFEIFLAGDLESLELDRLQRKNENEDQKKNEQN